jgi:BioD-like phosphotransacetylase family protein
MKALYVTSVEPYSGKTAVCLALGKQLQAAGRRVGYLKPMSTQPWRTPQGRLGDEDSAFVQSALGLEETSLVHSPVIITPESLRQRLEAEHSEDLLPRVLTAAEAAGRDRDVLLLEGGASLREGYAMGLSNPRLAEALGAPVIVVVKYHAEMQCLDDALTAQFRLRELLMGVIVNAVPAEAEEFVQRHVRPFLNKAGIRMLGALPRRAELSAMSVGELTQLLHATVLTKAYDPQRLAQAFTVGAMTMEAALSRFRRQQDKVVITGGDRTDIQLAALETSTVALILTGNLHPSPLVVQQAEAVGVPLLLVAGNTMETVETIERAYGKTRLGQAEKLDTFMELMTAHVDTAAILAAIGLS